MKRSLSDSAAMPSVIQSLRLPFLLLTPLCSLLGVSLYDGDWSAFPWLSLLAALSAALMAHIAVNTFNEWEDYRSGLDRHTLRTPFSGGSGALVANPAALQSVFITAVTSLLFTVLLGLWLSWQHGWPLMALGLLGVALILAYTRWINRLPWLCLIAPGLGFGPVMVGGLAWVVNDRLSFTALAVSLVPFFLVNNLLLLNQYPDIEADRNHGRRHLPIVYGVPFSNVVYALFSVAALLWITLLWNLDLLPVPALWLLLLALPMAFVITGMQRHGAQIGQYPAFLGVNVAINLLMPLGLALVLLT